MLQVDLRHDIACDAETYWSRCFFNEAFNRELYATKLGFGFEQLYYREEGGSRSRKVRIEPSIAALPAVLKKLVGERLAYTEEGTLDPKTGIYALRTEPSVFADKATVAGNIRLENKPDGTIVRVLALKIEVRVFGVGGMAESKIADDVRHSYDVGASFTNEFVRR